MSSEPWWEQVIRDWPQNSPSLISAQKYHQKQTDRERKSLALPAAHVHTQTHTHREIRSSVCVCVTAPLSKQHKAGLSVRIIFSSSFIQISQFGIMLILSRCKHKKHAWVPVMNTAEVLCAMTLNYSSADRKSITDPPFESAILNEIHLVSQSINISSCIWHEIFKACK